MPKNIKHNLNGDENDDDNFEKMALAAFVEGDDQLGGLFDEF